MPVAMPWPPSTKGLSSLTVPSGWISRKAATRVPGLGAIAPAPSAGPCAWARALRPGRATLSTRALPAAARKPRRDAPGAPSHAGGSTTVTASARASVRNWSMRSPQAAACRTAAAMAL